MKNTLRMGAFFLAGIAIASVGGSYAFNGMGHPEVKVAVDAGDYNTFVTVAPDKLLEKIDSEAAFQEFAANRQEMEALRESTQAAVLAAVQSNDYDAFLAAHQNMKTQMEINHPGDDARPTPTAEQQAKFEANQQANFDKLVEYYQANGELPERTMGHGFGKRGMRGGHGDCGARGEKGPGGPQDPIEQE